MSGGVAKAAITNKASNIYLRLCLSVSIETSPTFSAITITTGSRKGWTYRSAILADMPARTASGDVQQ